MLLLSRKDLNSAELDTIRVSRNPATVTVPAAIVTNKCNFFEAAITN